jgi:hypothetical protein
MITSLRGGCSPSTCVLGKCPDEAISNTVLEIASGEEQERPRNDGMNWSTL